MKNIFGTIISSVCAVILMASCEGVSTVRLREADEVLLLYPEGQAEGSPSILEGMPGPIHSNGLAGPEEKMGGGFICNVGDSARIDIYYPKKPNGQAVVVCPGGGYSSLNADIMGAMAGNWLSENGVTTVVLKYRMPEGDMALPMRDVTNAMLYCRSRAQEWGVTQIGIAGGSAGGHLAAFATSCPEVPEARPDFAVLLYPLTTLMMDNTDEGILLRMFGHIPTMEERKSLSAEFHVSDDMPPVFIAANRHDWILTQDHYIRYYSALVDKKADAELHIYGEGTHGWGFSNPKYWNGDEYTDWIGGSREVFETELLHFLERIYDPKLYLDTTMPVEDRVDDLMSRMTVDEKIGLLRTLSPAIPRLGMDKYYHGNEALHGVVRPGRFTVFPQAVALGAMWDPEMVEKVSTAISDEARARWNALDYGRKQDLAYGDLLTFWSPTVNMARDPRWGRTAETYGEDPFLSGKTGAAFVRGMQGDDARYLKVVSTAKHFAVNNEEHNRFECKVNVPEKMLREYYLPAFETLVKEGHVQSAMAAYNTINDTPCTCNHWLLTDVLRDEWGFDGYVVSDCGGVVNLLNTHHYATDMKEAAALALKAGLDLECGDNAYVGPLREAYDEGMVGSEDIDRAARNILSARMKLGLFDPADSNPYSRIPESVIGCEEHRNIALEAARESVVMLKNDGILPLDKSSLKRIGVIGINASKCELGDYTGSPTILPVSVLDGIREKCGEDVEVLTTRWRTAGNGMTLIESEYFEDGIKAEYYHGLSFEEKCLERTEPFIYYEPENQAPDPLQPVHHMSARWSGILCPDMDGEYEFMLDVFGGGNWMWFDGELVVGKSWNQNTFKRVLHKGERHSIVVEYNHERDYNCLKLLWKKPDADASENIHAEALDVARRSDVVVAVMGYNKSIEREGVDREELSLPADQIEFLKAIRAVNDKVVLVVVAGNSLALNWEDKNMSAILESWYGGEYGGTAVADILFGDVNPSGKLPLTFYRSVDQLPPFDDYQMTNGRTYKYLQSEPLYEFGYGLSYTTFEYSDLKVTRKGDAYRVRFSIRNTGEYDGDEVAQVYVRMPDYEGISPIKELKGFARVSLCKGEKKNVEVVIPDSSLRFWSESGNGFRYSTEVPEIMVGASSSDIRLTNIK